MNLAAIDIGSNAVRLFFAHVYQQQERIIAEKTSLVRVPLRLGKEVFETRIVPDEKIKALIKTMTAFRLLIEVNRPLAYRAFATAALREADNSTRVIEQIAAESGIRIEVIDGQTEAAMLASLEGLQTPVRAETLMFIDVGGGSTEISLISHGRIARSESFRIGTVRLLNQRVDEQEWKRMKTWLKKNLRDFSALLAVGSGGNINKLHSLFGKPPGKLLSVPRLEKGMQSLAALSLEQRIHDLGLRPDRADVIIPAAQIFHFILKTSGCRKIFVPKIGLSDGMVHQMFREQIALQTIKKREK